MIAFSSKAETLESLENCLKKADVLPQIRMNALNWNKAIVKSHIEKKNWREIPLIVRSSCCKEDLLTDTQAGKYTSIPNVCGLNNLYKAIEKVISSYTPPSADDHFFIQPMLQRSLLSGVACSFDPATGAPYRVINYDDHSGKTDSVTSGSTNNLKLYYTHRSQLNNHPAPLCQIIDLMIELENIFKHPYLDIEFSISETNKLYLLQVRPLLIKDQPNNLEIHTEILQNIAIEIGEISRPHPYLVGSKALFGVMPDWNPAEIVGTRPRPLALSLYQELITDKVWAIQRGHYGYRKIRNFPILVNFYGLPYIDIRVSFNSFVPSDLKDALAEKLVDFYSDKLSLSPHLHDKIEFDVAFTCYTLDLKERLSVLKKNGFSDEEIDEINISLKKLTNRIIHPENGLFFEDIQKINTLDEKRKTIVKSDLPGLSKIFWLIEDCKEYGTTSFSGIARAAFIAFHMLKSLIDIKLLSPQEGEVFLSSLTSVCSLMQKDRVELNQQEFLERYGHLRQGTYDILSPNYESIPNHYFQGSARAKSRNQKNQFSLSLEKQKEVDLLLQEHGIHHTCKTLFTFFRTAIEAREHAKYLFTKNVNDVLKLIEELGIEMHLSKDDCSYLNIKEILKFATEKSDLKSSLENSIIQGKKSHHLCKTLILPSMICQPEEVFSHSSHQTAPNYVTQQKVVAQVSISYSNPQEIENKILMIPSADPGYEWVFTHSILGLITMYGGMNSHMSIRAYEMGIPAVIGAGEALYKQWSQADILELDCENKTVRIIR